VDAKAALLGTNQPPVIGVDQAKAALFSSVPAPVIPVPPTASEAKQLLLGNKIHDKNKVVFEKTLNKQQQQGKLPETGPTLYGIPYRFLDDNNKAEAIRVSAATQERLQVQAAEEVARVQREQDAIISDAGLEGVSGAVGNIGVGAVSGAVDVATGIASTVTKGLNLVGLSDEAAEQINVGLDAFSGAAAKLVNRKNQEKALVSVQKNSQQAVEEFKDGKYFSGIGTILKSGVELAVDNPAAALEFTANSLPQMYVLAKNAIVGVGSLTSTGYDDAIEEFEKEHGREPDANEKAVAGLLSLAAASLDALGAKSVLGLKDVILNVEKLGIKTAAKTVSGAKALLRVPKAIVVEGTTEGAQNLLVQQAGKQDVSKLDIAEAITDTTIGAVSGAHLASPVAAVEAVKSTEPVVKKTKAAIHKVATAVAEKGKEAGIGKVD